MIVYLLLRENLGHRVESFGKRWSGRPLPTASLTRGPGGFKRASLDRHGKLTAEQARQRAVVAIGPIKRGEHPLAEPSGPVTVADLAQRFLDDYVVIHCKARTREQYAGIVRSVIVSA